MKKLLKQSYMVTKFSSDSKISNGEIYVCDNRKDIVIQCVLKDAYKNSSEEYVKCIESIIKTFIEEMKEVE